MSAASQSTKVFSCVPQRARDQHRILRVQELLQEGGVRRKSMEEVHSIPPVHKVDLSLLGKEDTTTYSILCHPPHSQHLPFRNLHRISRGGMKLLTYTSFQ